jgi:hypothetical protein
MLQMYCTIQPRWTKTGCYSQQQQHQPPQKNQLQCLWTAQPVRLQVQLHLQQHLQLCQLLLPLLLLASLTICQQAAAWYLAAVLKRCHLLQQQQQLLQQLHCFQAIHAAMNLQRVQKQQQQQQQQQQERTYSSGRPCQQHSP